jgi:hypothetical protein
MNKPKCRYRYGRSNAEQQHVNQRSPVYFVILKLGNDQKG